MQRANVVRESMELRRAGAAACLLLAAGCYHAMPERAAEPPAAPDVRVSYPEQKAAMVREIEVRMNAMIREYGARLDGIREGLIADLAALRPPVRLLAVESAFRGYGASDEERFDATIEHLVDDAVARTLELVGREETPGHEAIVGRAEEEAWRAAADVGNAGRGAGYGFVSGVEEIDERAQVTLEKLRDIGDPQTLRDLGEIRKSEAVELRESFRQDLNAVELFDHARVAAERLEPAHEGMSDRAGRIVLFESDVLEDFRLPGQDTVAAVVAFENARLPAERRFELVQAVRNRVVRGGVLVRDFGWRLDAPAAAPPALDGRLPLSQDLFDPRSIASEPQFPGVDTDHPRFAELIDMTLVHDVATGVLDVASGELLGTLRWQRMWTVTRSGNVRFLPSVEPSFDAASEVLAELLAGATAAPASSDDDAVAVRSYPGDDLLARRVDPYRPAAAPLPRDLDGEVGFIAASLGPDHIRITPEGRRFLSRRRMAVLAEAHFLSYLEGNRMRDVLRLSAVPTESPLRDLGFRSGDDVLEINGVPITRFTDLWNFFAEHPRESRYEVHFTRGAALRRTVFEVEGVPAAGAPEPVAEVDQNPAVLQRITYLLTGGDTLGGVSTGGAGGEAGDAGASGE